MQDEQANSGKPPENAWRTESWIGTEAGFKWMVGISLLVFSIVLLFDLNNDRGRAIQKLYALDPVVEKSGGDILLKVRNTSKLTLTSKETWAVLRHQWNNWEERVGKKQYEIYDSYVWMQFVNEHGVVSANEKDLQIRITFEK